MVLKTYSCMDLQAILKGKLWLLFDLRNLHGNFGVTLKSFKPKFVAFLSLPV